LNSLCSYGTTCNCVSNWLSIIQFNLVIKLNYPRHSTTEPDFNIRVMAYEVVPSTLKKENHFNTCETYPWNVATFVQGTSVSIPLRHSTVARNSSITFTYKCDGLHQSVLRSCWCLQILVRSVVTSHHVIPPHFPGEE